MTRSVQFGGGYLVGGVMLVLLLLCPAETWAQAGTAQPDTTSEAYQVWEADLEDARADRSRGQTIFWVGLGASVASPLLIHQFDPGTWRLSAVIGTAGGVAAVYGGITWLQAANEIDDLESEGRRQGYVTLIPEIREGRVGGVRVSVGVPLSFGR